MSDETVSIGNDQLAEMVKKLQAENAALKAKASAVVSERRLSFRVSEKGGVSVYGLGRFPITMYLSQWERLLAPDTVKELTEFLVNNVEKLATKASKADATKAVTATPPTIRRAGE